MKAIYRCLCVRYLLVVYNPDVVSLVKLLGERNELFHFPPINICFLHSGQVENRKSRWQISVEEVTHCFGYNDNQTLSELGRDREREKRRKEGAFYLRLRRFP